MYVNVAVVGADQVVKPEICAITEIVYVPAYARTFVSANEIVLPDTVIREVPVPPATVMAKFIV